MDLQYDADVGRATGAAEVQEDFISSLSRISQLTGFSDALYAEAYVKVAGFDILLGKHAHSSCCCFFAHK